jgi:hypothetical protein
VGWRERDWAKWTDAERERFLGSSRSPAGPPGGPPARWSAKGGGGKRRTRRETLAALILIAAAVAYYSGALNRSPQRTVNHVIGPTPYLRLPHAQPMTPTVAPPITTTMSGPSSVPRGTYMTVTGTLPLGVSGPIIVEGQWESGPWYELASTNASKGGFRVRYTLPRPGVVHVRLALPNGDYAIKTIRVT